LNLFGGSSLLYNVEEGTFGTIIGNGNVGLSLQNYSVSNLYLSRDFGVTWSRIKNQSHLFDIDPISNLITVIDSVYPSLTISYSYNSGYSWNFCEIKSNSSETQQGIFINSEFGTAENYTWVQTQYNDSNGKTYYTLYSIYLDQNQEICTENDYEEITTECILGQKISYKTPKQNATCYGNSTQTQIEYCNCTRNDYVCRYCFISDPTMGDCIPNSMDSTCTSYLSSLQSGCTPGGNYSTSSPYKKLVQTKCINSPTTFSQSVIWQCPNQPASPTPTTGLPTSSGFPFTSSSIPINLTPTPTPSPASISNTDTAPSSSSSAAGIAVGVVIGALFLVVVVSYAVLKYRSSKEKKQFDEMSMDNIPKEDN